MDVTGEDEEEADSEDMEVEAGPVGTGADPVGTEVLRYQSTVRYLPWPSVILFVK